MARAGAAPRQPAEVEVAVLGDLLEIGALLADAENMTQDRIRQSSGIVRRLLIYRDLHAVANSFGGLTVQAIDNKAIYHAEGSVPYPVYASFGCTAFGIFFARAMSDVQGVDRRHETWPNPEVRIPLSLDNFLRQRVIAFKGTWATREQVIKYVANKASGTHSDQKRADPHDMALNRVRNALWMGVSDDGIPSITFRTDRIDQPKDEFEFRRGSIDPVFLEFLATMYFLHESPDTQALVAKLKAEYP